MASALHGKLSHFDKTIEVVSELRLGSSLPIDELRAIFVIDMAWVALN